MNKIIRWITVLKVLCILTVLNHLYELLQPLIKHTKLDYVYFFGYIDIYLVILLLIALFRNKTWILIPAYLQLILLISAILAIYFGPHGRQLHIPIAVGQVVFQLLIIRFLSKKDVKEYFLSQQELKEKGTV